MSKGCTCPVCQQRNSGFDQVSYNFDGTACYDTFPGVKSGKYTVDSDDTIGRLEQIMGLTRVYGHSLTFSEHNIYCKDCDMSVEMDDLLRQTSGFRQVVFKLMKMQEFKTTVCEGSDYPPSDSAYNPDPGNIYTDTVSRVPVYKMDGTVKDVQQSRIDALKKQVEQEQSKKNDFNRI